MRQLLPEPLPVENVLELLAADPRPERADRPWVMANMVLSVDGAYASGGRSAGLSGPADRTTFHAVRGLADEVLVAAGTARAERYRRPVPEDGAGSLRARRGQAPAARLVVVSRSLRIPDDQPFLTGEGPDPLVLHPATSDPAALPPGVEARACGDNELDLGAALGTLAGDGSSLVLCEGGPLLLGQLVELDLLDELFLTLSPVLAGGPQVGLLGRVAGMDRPLKLHRVLEDDGFLLLTYRRRRG